MRLSRLAGTAAVCALALVGTRANAVAVALTANTPYTQDFAVLAPTGTSAVLPLGWEIAESDTNANASYTANNGSSTTGDTYSYGSTGAADRALGSLGSGSLSSTFGAIFQNTTGATITAFTLSYIGEQWRNGSASADSLRFQYLVGATSVGTGTWTDFSDLDFASIIGGSAATLNGNLAANRVAIDGIVSGLSIANNGTLGIRWMDVDIANGEDGLAIDDLTLTTQSAVPEPATWGLMVIGFGALGATMRRRRPIVRFI